MSYLDRKNILSEGFFDSLKKFFNRPKLSKQEKKREKDAVKRFYKAHDKLQNRLKELDKKYGLDKKK